ncbi:MAG TPA: DUF4388 domain-containing protein, partial [Kofleriaceae bacterium]|nr:DUF4388 domain-containing protein [Kofleriaceae bacterium]
MQRLAQPTGDLELRPLPAVLLDLHEAGVTGRFLVRRDRVVKTVDLLEGSLLAATAGDDTLGHFLVASGIITQSQHRDAVAYATDHHASLGEALIAMGLLTPDKLDAQLTAQTRYRLLSPLRWPVGAWRFEERDLDPRGLKLPIPETVLNGLRDTAAEGPPPSQLLADTVLELTPRGRRLLPLLSSVFAARVADDLPEGTTPRILIAQGLPPALVDAMVLTDSVLPALPKVGPALLIEAARAATVEPEAEPTSELYQELFGGPSMLISVPALMGTAPIDPDVGLSPFDSDDDDEPIITIIEDEAPVDDASRVARDALTAEAHRLHDLDHYAVLMVDPHADDLTIAAALSERTSTFSRDYYARFQLGDAGDLLDEVHAAYEAAREVLLDDERRAAYDRELAGGDLADRGGEVEKLRDAGLELVRRGAYEVGASKLEAALALRADDPAILAALGWATWHRDGKTADAGDLARYYLNRALRRAPNLGPANEYLGLVELALGVDEQTALDHLERAARAGNAEAHVLDAITTVYLRRAQPRGLERLFRRLLRGGGSPQVQGPVWHRLGVLYADHLDDPAQARTAFGQAARLGHTVRPPRRIPSNRPAGPTDAEFVALSLRIAAGDDRPGDRELYDELRPRTLPRATSTMTSALWNQLRHPLDEPDLGALAELLAPAAHVLHPITLADLGVDPSARMTDETLPPAFAAQQAYIAGLLGLPRVPVHAHPDFGDEVHVGACAQLTLLAGDDALTAPDRPDLGFRIARATTYLWPGRAIGGSRPARVLRALFLALAREVGGSGAGAGGGSPAV